MKDWDVSQVTDFSYLFMSYTNFNEDISCWDVSSGINFVSTAHNFEFQFNTIQYNSIVTGLNHLTNNFLFLSFCKYAMFAYASSFNQDLSDWNLSSTSNRVKMFKDTAMPCDDDSFYPSECTGICRNTYCP